MIHSALRTDICPKIPPLAAQLTPILDIWHAASRTSPFKKASWPRFFLFFRPPKLTTRGHHLSKFPFGRPTSPKFLRQVHSGRTYPSNRSLCPPFRPARASSSRPFPHTSSEKQKTRLPSYKTFPLAALKIGEKQAIRANGHFPASRTHNFYTKFPGIACVRTGCLLWAVWRYAWNWR